MPEQSPSGYPLQDYYSRIYKTYDLVNRLFTLGMDRKWRKRTVQVCLQDDPGRILDLCCGTGDITLEIARAALRISPLGLHITGYDLNDNMLAVARGKAERYQLKSVEFVKGDAASMPFADREFDRITIGFGFRNLTWGNPNCARHLEEISRVMKPGAKLLILESAVPGNRLIRFLYMLYLKLILVPLGGLLSGDWSAYRYLAGSSSGFYSFSDLKEMLLPYRLNLQLVEKYLMGSVNLLIATKKAT